MLEKRSKPDQQDCAALVLDAVPLAMGFVRNEMRRHRGADLSIPQFRTLTYLLRHQGAALKDVAERLGITPASMSKMIDGLEARGLVERKRSHLDKRCIVLTLTDQGTALLNVARRHTQSRLAELMDGLSTEDKAVVARAMEMLRRTFSSDHLARGEG